MTGPNHHEAQNRYLKKVLIEIMSDLSTVPKGEEGRVLAMTYKKLVGILELTADEEESDG